MKRPCNDPKCSCKPSQDLIKTIVIPASWGDEEGSFGVHAGAYYNTVVTYQASGKSYLYDSRGAYTAMTNGDCPEPAPAELDFGTFTYIDRSKEEPTEKTIKLDLRAFLEMTEAKNRWGSSTITVRGKTIPCADVLAYDTGDELEFLPNKFLGSDMDSVDAWTNLASIRLGNKLKTIGMYFLYNNSGSPITEFIIDGPLEEIGSYSFYQCNKFNAAVHLPDTVKTIGTNVFSYLSQMNSPITFADKFQPTSIGDYMLYSLSVFNQPFKFPKLEPGKVGQRFACSWPQFNSPVELPAWKTYPYQMMYSWSKFDQPVVVPEGVERIDGYFLGNASVFNSPLILPNTLTYLSNYFLYQAYLFDQDLTIPASLTSISNYFMYENRNYQSVLTVNSQYPPADNYSLSVSSPSYLAYVNGVALKGDAVAKWMTALPNRSGPYRKLVERPDSPYAAYTLQETGERVEIWDKDTFNYYVNSTRTNPYITKFEFLPECKKLTTMTALSDEGFMYRQPYLAEITGWENLPDTITKIGSYFLYGCTAFNDTLPDFDGVTFVGNYFMQDCVNFNQPLPAFRDVQSVGVQFMYRDTAFDSAMPAFSSLVSIGNNFLRGCTAFNQPVYLPATVTSIGNYFMNTCDSFTNIITTDTTTIPQKLYTTDKTDFYSLMGSSRTVPLSTVGPTFKGKGGVAWVRGVGDLTYASAPHSDFESDTPLARYTTVEGEEQEIYRLRFLIENFINLKTSPKEQTMQVTKFEFLPGMKQFEGATELNKIALPISTTGYSLAGQASLVELGGLENLPDTMESLGYGFLQEATSFNQPLTIPAQITDVGANFLYDCSSFNQPLALPNSLKEISNNFLYNCSNFNQPFTIPSTVTEIKGYFMYNCVSFSQPLTIPESVTSIGHPLMCDIRDFTGPLEVNTSTTPDPYPNNDVTLRPKNIDCPAAVQGITLTGAYAQVWKDAYPNRKLIVAN